MAVRLIQMILFTACVTVFWASGLAAWKASRFAACGKAAAWERAKDSVRAELIAPKVAEFPGLDQVSLKRAGSCAWEVRGYVDAVNLHGVFLRADFAAHVGGTAEGRNAVRLVTLTTRPAQVGPPMQPDLIASGI